MRKSKLAKRDIEICMRLRDARELLGLSQAECARQIGLDRSTFLNYEHARTPIRFEIGLRFCRQFIISEEWLATGRFDAMNAEAPKHGIKPGPGLKELEMKIFSRQCMDLFSEPVSRHIPPGTLFGDSYDRFLAPEYRRLVTQFFYLPRISFSSSDSPELAINLLTAINQRFIILLQNEAIRRGKHPSSAWRVYARCLFETADLVFLKMMKVKLDSARMQNLEWMRKVASENEAVIEFLDDNLQTHHRSEQVLTS